MVNVADKLGMDQAFFILRQAQPYNHRQCGLDYFFNLHGIHQITQFIMSESIFALTLMPKRRKNIWTLLELNYVTCVSSLADDCFINFAMAARAVQA